jgi:glycosyltransferase involved in cell wall biosynthesis
LLHLYQVAVLLHGASQSRFLPPDVEMPDGGWPTVSIIVAARDEEAEIEKALQSLLALDYPNFEVIVVNDRSRDGTGAVLERMRGTYPQLKVVTVTELPAGWLGKNHALNRGVREATGDWLLFTDADIVFEPRTLKRSLALIRKEGIDHLTISPAIRSDSFWVNLLVTIFMRNFGLFVRPWKARDPKSKYYVGLGAFNLVRRAVYEKVGGHEAIRLRPDDDMKLGKIIKTGGFHQEVVIGVDALSLQWYSSVDAMMRGLEKNVLAGADYRLGFMLFSLAAVFFADAGFWFLLPFADLPTACVLLAAGLLSMLSAALFFPNVGRSWLWAVLTPLLSTIMVYIFLRSIYLTLYRGGIAWRGCFYPLAELKENQV